ncbi:MAG: group II intron maturase-specific domain-containing protein [Pseudonocardiaceae bacterium]
MQALGPGEQGLSCQFHDHIRRYPDGKLLIKPSPLAVRRVTRRLADEMRSLRGSNVRAVLARLTPIVRGWAAYYRRPVLRQVQQVQE